VKLLVTGARGFIGRNVMLAISEIEGCQAIGYDLGDAEETLSAALDTADAVVHLAGVNRPADVAEFQTGNTDFTRLVCNGLMARGRSIPLVLSSSTQAALENPYGVSKRAAEEVVRGYAHATGAIVAIGRLPGVFGKWCRPNYNSVVATFCHNAARRLPLVVSDPVHEIELVHVDDVVRAFLDFVQREAAAAGVTDLDVAPRFRVTLGRLAALIDGFGKSRETLDIPDLSDPFTRKLAATYLTYLPSDKFAYDLVQHRDERGVLAELLKSDAAGQIFVSRTRPGITRGHHYHHAKFEKFFVVEGDAIIRFRHMVTGECVSYPVSGVDFRVTDIPPGWAHSIENVGTTELIVVFWAGERFNKAVPDTHRAEVARD
jgi:UDP-2-acetamido-2,6-beta-L-arabino-hexul-4-ose reductase